MRSYCTQKKPLNVAKRVGEQNENKAKHSKMKISNFSFHCFERVED
jgi:hypothetical protein